MDSLFNNSNKVHIVCGDFNIDLLNPQKNVKITDFINITLYFLLLLSQPELLQIHQH